MIKITVTKEQKKYQKKREENKHHYFMAKYVRIYTQLRKDKFFEKLLRQ